MIPLLLSLRRFGLRARAVQAFDVAPDDAPSSPTPARIVPPRPAGGEVGAGLGAHAVAFQ